MTCFIVIFALLHWSATEPAISPRYAWTAIYSLTPTGPVALLTCFSFQFFIIISLNIHLSQAFSHSPLLPLHFRMTYFTEKTDVTKWECPHFQPLSLQACAPTSFPPLPTEVSLLSNPILGPVPQIPVLKEPLTELSLYLCIFYPFYLQGSSKQHLNMLKSLLS